MFTLKFLKLTTINIYKNTSSNFGMNSDKVLNQKYASHTKLGFKLFIFGGCDMKGLALKSSQYIDLLNRKEFINISDMPRVKAGSAIVTIDEKIVTIGGIYDKQRQLDKVDIYDITSDSWTQAPSLSNPAQGSIVVNRDNVIYCGGGLTTDMVTLKNFGMLDLKVGNWQELPPMPTSHFSAGSFLYNDNLYVIGGREGKLFSAFCNCYDFRSKAWRSLPAVPSDYRNIFNSCVLLNDQVYVIGGLNDIPTKGFSNMVYMLDLKSEKWERMVNILKARADFGLFGIDDHLLIAGGMGNLQGLSQSVEMYNIKSKRWSLNDDLPVVHASSTKCLYERSMFLISGLSPAGPTKNVTEIMIN